MIDNRILKRILTNIEKVIVGKREVIELVLIALICRGHVLIEDVPGVGKTSLARALAKSLDCTFKRIQFTPDIMPSDITGFNVFNPKTGDFDYKEGAVLSQIILADEINRTSPKTQSALLEAMEEKQVTVDGETYKLKEPFIVLATQNPIEYIGTYPLPEAQMDRFFMRLSLGYPDPDQEIKIITRNKKLNPLDSILPVASAADICHIQDSVADIYLSFKVAGYIVEIINNTRLDKYTELGASPRASIALARAAQACALYNSRDFVLPDDVLHMAKYVLPHRIVPSHEARLKKITQENIVLTAAEDAHVPIE